MTDEAEDETGGYDATAFARRRAQAAEAPAFKPLVEPEEPAAFTQWLAERDAPIESKFRAFVAELGPKPKQSAGPLGAKRRAELAEWWALWSEGRLAMDRDMSALFSDFPPELAAQPAALYHGQLRADRRRTLVEQSEQKLKERLEELSKAKAKLEEVEAPKRAGRAVAMAAVQAGYAKLAAALEKEKARNARALAKIADLPLSAAPAAQAHEDARLAAAEAGFRAKLTALKTLEASLQPVSADSVQD